MGEVWDLLWQPQGREDISNYSCKDLQVSCLKGTCHRRVVLLKAMKSVLSDPTAHHCTCLSFARNWHKTIFQEDPSGLAHMGSWGGSGKGISFPFSPHDYRNREYTDFPQPFFVCLFVLVLSPACERVVFQFSLHLPSWGMGKTEGRASAFLAFGFVSFKTLQ